MSRVSGVALYFLVSVSRFDAICLAGPSLLSRCLNSVHCCVLFFRHWVQYQVARVSNVNEICRRVGPLPHHLGRR